MTESEATRFAQEWVAAWNSRDLERILSHYADDVEVTSPLVPWISCGAYMAGVLGVATISYLPYCFFNLLSPVISLIYGFTGFRIERLPSPGADGEARTQAPAEVPA